MRESALDAILDSDDDEFSDYEDDYGDEDAELSDGSALVEDGEMPCQFDSLGIQESPALEDGEIPSEPVSLAIEPKDQRFVSVDIDAAIRNAKERSSKSKKKKKKRHRKKQNPEREKLNERRRIINICYRLKERKRYLIEAAVKVLGLDRMTDLVEEVETIESTGGQMTADGKRRRTPGGVLLNILRSRSPENYKSIMTAVREYEKQLQKERQQKCNNIKVDQKRKATEDSMNIDGQPPAKRQRDGHQTVTNKVPQVKKTGTTIWPFQKQHVEKIEAKVDPYHSQEHTQVLSAWVEGLKKEQPECVKHVMNDANSRVSSVSERIRAPVRYDDILEA